MPRKSDKISCAPCGDRPKAASSGQKDPPMRFNLPIFSAASALCLVATLAFAGVDIAKTNGEARHIKTEKYEADIAADGALSSLKIKGQEMLKPGVGVSRG